jgi:long-subunit acyl-CoA synthetase (AMP-forming)
LKTSLVGIIIPDPEVLPAEVSKKLGLTDLSMEELCLREDVKQLIMKDIIEVGQAAKLLGFEQVNFNLF